MATNNNGSLLDSAGEIAIDAVWGNMPPQPNDARTTRLDLTLGDHINLESGWGGYPQFTANTAGSDVAGSTDYVQVSDVRGLTTAIADDLLKDNGLTVTTATAAANAKTDITRVNATSATVEWKAGATAGTSQVITWAKSKGHIAQGANPITQSVAAVSVGIINSLPMLDLCYEEDVTAETDMNIVCTGDGNFIEVQGTAEGKPFDRSLLNGLLDLGAAGCLQLSKLQAQALA